MEKEMWQEALDTIKADYKDLCKEKGIKHLIYGFYIPMNSDNVDIQFLFDDQTCVMQPYTVHIYMNRKWLVDPSCLESLDNDGGFKTVNLHPLQRAKLRILYAAFLIYKNRHDIPWEEYADVANIYFHFNQVGVMTYD